MLLENNQVARMSSQKKKTPTELSKLKRNKMLNTGDRAITVTIGMIKKVYVGSTQGPFKQRYYNHKSSIAHEILT